jgi:hypothetical protein
MLQVKSSPVPVLAERLCHRKRPKETLETGFQVATNARAHLRLTKRGEDGIAIAEATTCCQKTGKHCSGENRNERGQKLAVSSFHAMFVCCVAALDTSVWCAVIE